MTFRLVTIGGILLLVAEFLLFSKGFPLVLDFRSLIAPLLADYLGDFRVCKAWVLGNDLALMMLAIKNEC